MTICFDDLEILMIELSTTLQKKKKIQINIDIAKANRISNSY
jgi:hypothetical protein